MTNTKTAVPRIIEVEYDGRVTRINTLPLRDLFAAFALSGMLASGEHFDGQDDDTTRAAQAYSFADAMLRAREQK